MTHIFKVGRVADEAEWKEKTVRKATTSEPTIAVCNNIANRNAANIPTSSIVNLFLFSDTVGAFWHLSVMPLTAKATAIS